MQSVATRNKELSLYHMLMHLCQQREIVLYNEILKISDEDRAASLEFLESQFEREKIEYPNPVPKFSPDAALWAASTLYYASQFLLFREHDPKELQNVIVPYSKSIDASAIISADLSLRFIPDLLILLDHINPDDELIQHLQQVLKPWVFSLVRGTRNMDDADLSIIGEDSCLRTIFIDRIMLLDNTNLNTHPLIKAWKSEVLGIHVELKP